MRSQEASALRPRLCPLGTGAGTTVSAGPSEPTRPLQRVSRSSLQNRLRGDGGTAAAMAATGSSRRASADSRLPLVTNLPSAVTEAERERPRAQPQRRPDANGRVTPSRKSVPGEHRTSWPAPRRSLRTASLSRKTAYLASCPLAAVSLSIRTTVTHCCSVLPINH